MNATQLQAEKHVLDYVKNHSKRESLGYNNNCYSMYVNPTEEHKKQYEINREYILNHFL